MPDLAEPTIRRHAPIPTWLGVGGTADRLAEPDSIDALRQCLAMDRHLLVLGDGANLLVADGGVRRLVVSLKRLAQVRIDPASGRVCAQAGASLMRLVQQTARAGLAGLHTLAGVPATVGGAVAMNAGGAHGCTHDHLAELVLMDRTGAVQTVPAQQLNAGYRDGGLAGRIVVEATFQLRPQRPEAIRQAVKAIMAQKKQAQPLAADSAGCAFKNPTLPCDLPGIGHAGQRVSAGRLIDLAQGKGMAVGGARVSERHANFIVVDPNRATAGHVLELMDAVVERVRQRFGITLQREIVVWGAAP